MFEIALHEPCIAPNTGNIIRLTANIGCRLHLIEPLGFDLEDKQLHRAGLDYHDLTNVVRHADYEQFVQSIPGCRILACTTKGNRHFNQVEYKHGDVLLFGSETSGLPPPVLQSLDPSNCIRIPMQPASRTLNLSNAVAIISYEAWRQHGFTGGQ
ncbi:MAG TPA: tRNA (cytidine(34)-2'-O)-methyltransferase [Nitrospiria bacterium]|jgi:tRNA (cytidine/uridine-2'-O-)-methyltransferase